MENQITIKQVRTLMNLINPLLPILNQEEYFKFINLCGDVIDRYKKEEYPNGLPGWKN